MKDQGANNEGSFVTGRSCEMKIILTLKCSLNLFWRWGSFFTCSTDFVVHTSWQVLITKPRAISVNEGWSRCLAYGPCRRCAYCAGRGQLPGLSLGFHGASVSRFYDHACLVFLTNIFSCTTERFPCNSDVAIDLCPPLAIHIPSSTPINIKAALRRSSRKLFWLFWLFALEAHPSVNHFDLFFFFYVRISLLDRE